MTHIFDLIPQSIITSWLKGEYLIGISHSSAYEYIGWSLMIRGYYLYEVFEDRDEEEKTHWGYCLIDLKEKDLFFGGIRLWTAEDVIKDMDEKYLEIFRSRLPLYWRSDFSHFVHSPPKNPELFFAYKLLRNVEVSVLDEITKKLAENAGGKEKFMKVGPTPDNIDEDLKKAIRTHLCDKLEKELEDVERRAAEDGIPLMGLIRLELEVPSEPGCLIIRGQYGAIAPDPVAGYIKFSRLYADQKG